MPEVQEQFFWIQADKEQEDHEDKIVHRNKKEHNL